MLEGGVSYEVVPQVSFLHEHLLHDIYEMADTVLGRFPVEIRREDFEGVHFDGIAAKAQFQVRRAQELSFERSIQQIVNVFFVIRDGVSSLVLQLYEGPLSAVGPFQNGAEDPTNFAESLVLIDHLRLPYRRSLTLEQQEALTADRLQSWFNRLQNASR